MKKLIVVLAALLLVAGFAVTAMAADPVKFSGEFDYTIMTDFGDNSSEGWGNNYIDVEMGIDDMNTVTLEMWGNAAMGGPIGWGHFWITSDVGKAFDLPIGLKAKAGNYAIWTRKFEVTGHAWERVIRPYARPLGVGASMDFNGKATLDAGTGLTEAGALLAIPELGPASLEAYFLSSDEMGMQVIGANVKATGLLNEMLSFAGMFAYDLTDGAVPAWYWGAGVSVKYNILTVGVSANGVEDFVFDKIGIDVDAKFTDMIGATAALGLAIDDPVVTDTFYGADLSVYITPGASTWRVGYAITDWGYGYGINANALMNGGLYISAGIDF